MVMGCDGLCCVIGECNCRLLDALASRWSWVAMGGPVFLGNVIADC